MKSFEYKTVRLDRAISMEELAELLNIEGKNGWEYIPTHLPAGSCFLFKKETIKNNE